MALPVRDAAAARRTRDLFAVLGLETLSVGPPSHHRTTDPSFGPIAAWWSRAGLAETWGT